LALHDHLILALECDHLQVSKRYKIQKNLLNFLRNMTFQKPNCEKIIFVVFI
jgi:hypothetical protein